VILITITVSLMAVTGFIAWLLARRWPRVDLTAPSLSDATVRAQARSHRRFVRYWQERLDPSVTTGLALTAACAVIILGALGVFSLIIMIHHNSGLARYDHSASLYGAHHATNLSTHVLKDLSQLGGALVIVPLAVIVAILETRRLRSWSVIGFLTLCVGGQFLIANVTKSLVGRARPNFDRLAGFSSSSFPSGHAVAAAATFAAFALVIGRRRALTVRAALAGVAVGLSVGVAITRVWLGVHWLTDVLAGLAMGWAWFAFCSIAFGGRRLRFGQPVEIATAGGPQSTTTTTTGKRP
jgi:membrane-associated phospholipid phosphatase